MEGLFTQFLSVNAILKAYAITVDDNASVTARESN